MERQYFIKYEKACLETTEVLNKIVQNCEKAVQLHNKISTIIKTMDLDTMTHEERLALDNIYNKVEILKHKASDLLWELQA